MSHNKEEQILHRNATKYKELAFKTGDITLMVHSSLSVTCLFAAAALQKKVDMHEGAEKVRNRLPRPGNRKRGPTATMHAGQRVKGKLRKRPCHTRSGNLTNRR